MAEKTCFIMGYPSTGKTTFIGALWQSLTPNSIKTKLHLKKFTGNQAYITSLGNNWLSGKVFNRTLINEQNEEITISLIDDNKKEITFSFSDYSGEMFNNIYVDREINTELKNKICTSDAFMLFINPKTTHDPVNIASMYIPASNESTGQDDTIDYNKIDHDSTSAKLVEILQIIDYLCQRGDIKLSVVISAWDTIGTRYRLPQEFVKQELQLLFQYLKSNFYSFNVKYYGVSAQGAELHDISLTEDENLEKVEHLLEEYESNPIERIQVVDEQGITSHDITLPLWQLIRDEKGGSYE